MKVVSALKELEILVHNFLFFVETLTGATRAPRNVHLARIFWEIMHHIAYLKWAFIIYKTY